MKLTTLTILTIIVFSQTTVLFGQKRATAANRAVVVDERLAVLRSAPSLFAMPVQRMRRGRAVDITATRQADGVTFYRVSVPPNNTGWVQAEAVAGPDDDVRLVRLIQASRGFDRIERAGVFLEHFPDSRLRPAILLLLGDLIEEEAAQLTKRAARSFDRAEMAASGAPLHSFYLNFSLLDRYRRLGIGFFFDVSTKSYHYDGRTWRELIRRFPDSPEAVEARKRIADLGLRIAD